MKTKHTDVIINGIINVLIGILSVLMIYPFLYCLAYSFSDSSAAMIKPVTILPIKFTLENYHAVFKNMTLYDAFFVTVARTVSGIIYHVLIVFMAAYAISKTRMPGNRIIAIFLIIPMYFSGGLLPNYILLYNLHMFNSFLVYILPYGFYAFNMLIARTFFDSLPPSLEESAKIDGASDIRIFLKVIIPLSMPVMATITLFVGVFHWNAWFDAMLYITKRQLYPVSYLLQLIIKEATAAQTLITQGNTGAAGSLSKTSTESLKMAILIVTTIPIVLIYPFLQKYFIKGVLIGSVKG